MKELMSLPKITLSALVILSVISTLVAKLQSIHDIEYDGIKKELQDDVYPDDRFRHLIWFLQVSDLHLSVHEDYGRGSDLKAFCNETVTVIQPSVVLATGDLVDAQTLDMVGSSRQYVEEWQRYQQILYDSGVTNKTVWLDIRGNHDNSNVLNLDDKNDLYKKYSVQGPKYRRSYKYTLKNDTDVYNFIGIDACMNPCPKRPFNYLGVLQEDEYLHIKNLLKEAEGNFTVWFGHYPTSTMVAPYPGVRELIKSGPYLCGHLHTMEGMVPEMYTLQSNGALELELADWKDYRKYRICAIDHGLFSFTDHSLGQWPLILVTNPKDALLAMPTIEPLHRILKSTHIRVLIFSPYTIKTAQLKINDGEWILLKSGKPPLFIAPWKPLEYMEGLHKIAIYVKDSNGNEKTLHHRFSLDGTRPAFPLGGRFALLGHISVGQVIFGVTLVFILLPLCVLKIYFCFKKGDMIKAKSESNCCWLFLFKLSLFVSIDIVFWPVIIGAVYVATGPWFVGHLVDEKIGVCFVWGIFLAGTFIPGGLTYFAGFVYFITFYIPFILCLSHCLYHHYRNLTNRKSGPRSFLSCMNQHFLMLFFISWQSLSAVFFLFSYGTLAFFLGFLYSWSVIMALVLWRLVVTLPESKFYELTIIKSCPIVDTPSLHNINNCKADKTN